MEKPEVRYITTLKEVRIINDPYRQEILKTLDFAGKPLTAKEIAVIMGESPSKVNYHVGILAKHDFIKLDHTKTINGIIAKYYKMPTVSYSIQLEGKNSKEKEMSALRDIIVSVFNSARDIYVSQLAKSMDKVKEESKEDRSKEDDFLLSKKVYLSEDDRRELVSIFEKATKNTKEDGELHNLFISTIKFEE